MLFAPGVARFLGLVVEGTQRCLRGLLLAGGGKGTCVDFFGERRCVASEAYRLILDLVERLAGTQLLVGVPLVALLFGVDEVLSLLLLPPLQRCC